MNTTPDELDLEPDPFQEGCDAVRYLVAARERIDSPPGRFVDQWWPASEEALETAFKGRKRLTFRERRWLNFLSADRSALDAEEEAEASHLRQALFYLAQGYLLIAKDSNADGECETPAAWAVMRISKCVRLPANQRDWAERASGESAPSGIALQRAIGVSPNEFAEQLRLVQVARQSGDLRPLRVDIDRRQAEAVSALLAAKADQLKTTASELERAVTYDKQDQKVRVSRIALEGFRGSPGFIELDLTKGQEAASLLIMGDNGTGKSTIVDALEFGLQGRVGRSTNYEHSLGPLLPSISSDGKPTVQISLSDGSKVIRSLERRDDGRLVASDSGVRPGFRLAPLTLKRQDILRFLDTEALSRGQLFFDYFPTSSSEMAVRPEQQLEQLEDEAYELRIRRSGLVEEVAKRLGSEPDKVSSKDGLIAVVKEGVSSGLPLHKFDWEGVDPATRHAIEQLLGVMQRLAAIKRERQKGVEVLNPVRYREQAAILEGKLHAIGDEITEAFLTVTRAPYIDRIDVLFGQSGPVALDIVVHLRNGRTVYPQQLFSEGYRDLLALLFFVSVAKRASAEGQARVLVLDDVFQSVDSGVRSSVMEYLTSYLAGWQLIVTIHDRLWLEYMRDLLRRKGHSFSEVHIRQWTVEGGSQLVVGDGDPIRELRRVLEIGEPWSVCAIAGRTLELACSELSWRLQLSVTRRRDDKYTLGDLWPAVHKRLKKSNAASASEAVNTTYFLRNAAGAHYNEWATSLSLSEANAFGEAVVQFVASVWCSSCNDWVTGRSPASCRCGSVLI